MKIKRMVSILLSAAMLAGLLVCPATAAGSAGFTDISDEATAEAAEVLRVLGVVDGTGNGLFQPDRSLTRAEFCKMAIEVLGRGDEAASQSGRVIFSDVRADHWARGYINAAASKPSENEPPLVAGIGNGLFKPDDIITYGGAVAILMRALGYSDQDVGMGQRWYDGYLNTARAIGLTDGLSLSGDAAITRGQAAILFRSLLFTDLKGTDDPYLTKLGAKELDSALILSVDAVANDGSTGAIRTTQGVYKTDRAPFPASYEGIQGKVVLDKNDRVLAIELNTVGSDRAVIAADIQATYIRTIDGEKLDIEKPAEIKVYSAAEDNESPNYSDLWTDLRAGEQFVFHYSASGKLEYIYRRGAGTGTSGTTAMVAKNFSAGSNPFTALVGGSTAYRIYKNGAPALIGDIRKYDVATYDAASQVLQISDLKLTATYDNVSPNTTTPTSIKIMGNDFSVLPIAAGDLAQFKLGDTVTFLLTADGRIAGAVSPTEARSTIIGVVESESTSGNVVVKAANMQNFTFSGASTLSDDSVTQLKGQLVTITSGSSSRISVSRLTSRGSADGAWNVQAGTIGSLELAPSVKIYEKVGNSKLFDVDLEDVTCTTVPASKLLYVGKDYAGKVNLLILDNVTGDNYTYGFLTTGSKVTGTGLGGEEISNSTVTVESANGNSTLIGSIPGSIRRNTPGGVIASLDTLYGDSKMAGYVLLTAIKDVSRSAFTTQNGRTTVTINGSVYPVADNVVCYNEAADTWFGSLADARAFSDNLTIYYDKAPEDGGKIRMVVAET